MAHSVFTDFQALHAEAFGKRTINLGHRFHRSELFSDAGLARLIERTPRHRCLVNSMDVATHDPRSRREGMIGGLSGGETLEAVRKGHICIFLQQPGEADGGYTNILHAIYDTLGKRIPGFKSYNNKMSILISSPRAQVYYHADVAGQTLWQVRGRKRVYVYPNTPPFLPQDRLEKIVLGEAREVSLHYELWFDGCAEVIDLEPGRMLHWPLNSPHRIVNADCLNVSFMTEHMTAELHNAYAVNYANGILRRALGLQALARPQSGFGLYARRGLAAVHKYSRAQRRKKAGFTIDFQVDPSAPHGFRKIPAFELMK